MEPYKLAKAERFSNLLWLIIYLFRGDFSGFMIAERQEQKNTTLNAEDSAQDIILIMELTVRLYSDVCNINSSFSTSAQPNRSLTVQQNSIWRS